ncbi:hypothetical protein CEXT_584221 [Caerostris extrusa]|uniref:Uncharacterized protein n=1 Tax=Caerostris extrusa TaxID=172846 RepID=A0AAV4T4G1_CAEEX|nr:hypothetical protein CEXT_584221 [Caerostris extrusa]
MILPINPLKIDFAFGVTNQTAPVSSLSETLNEVPFHKTAQKLRVYMPVVNTAAFRGPNVFYFVPSRQPDRNDTIFYRRKNRRDEPSQIEVRFYHRKEEAC